MGWASAGAHFDTVADALLESNAPDHVIYTVCKRLIWSLQSMDWDTEGESLGMYDHPMIVQAFRECGIYEECNNVYTPIGSYAHYCTLEKGHSEDELHTWRGVSWTDEMGKAWD